MLAVATKAPAFPPSPRLVPPVPEPPARDLSMLGFISAAGRNGIGMFPRTAYEEPVLRRRLFGRERITVSDPDAVRRIFVDRVEAYARSPVSLRVLRPILGDGLLISSGAAWRHQRRTLAPAFTPRAVELLVPHILSATDEALDGLEREAGQGPLDLSARLQHLALEIAGRSMFSVGMRDYGAELRGHLEDYAARLARPRLLDFLLPAGIASPADRARARFRPGWTAFLDRVIAERGAGRDGQARDLLDLLSEARDPESDRAFTAAELRDQVATLILAGHETTALTLTWACTLLAQAPAIQEALAEEAQADPGSGDPMRRLPLTRAVVDETLRLYPPAFILSRVASVADDLAGASIAPGAIVIVSPWVLHRHRQLWDDPDAFAPERFLPGAPPVRRFTYLPFGAGPRICIGASFALTEAVLALSRLVGRFRIARADARPVLPLAAVTTQTDHAPSFLLERRGR